jgi:putative oxidoreductase
MDTGLLLLRVVLGLLMMGHGSQKLFGWFGGHGLEGTGGAFHGMGYRPGKFWAAVAGASELGGGCLLALGLLTPLGAAAIIGTMFNAAMAVHAKNGVWITSGGFEYTLVIATGAATLAFTGPGAASLDAALGLDLSGVWWGIAAIVVALVVGAASDIRRRAVGRPSGMRTRGLEQPA